MKLFNNLHLFELLEIIQYSVIFFCITTITSYILNKYIFIESEREIRAMSIFRLIVSTLSQLIILSIMFLYIRKISMTIPSIGSYLNPKYKAYSTHQYTIHIALVFFFLELTENIRLKLSLFRKLLHF